MGLTRIRAEQISDIDYKQAVRVITLTNITLSGGAPSTVDGVSLVTGDRVLVAGQSNAAQNGLYQVQTVGAGSNGTWVRTSDANEDGEIQPGMVVMVTQGTEYADTPWKLVTNGVIEIGVTELTFEENYSLAFGNIFANGTAVVANAVSAPITFAAGDNIAITGNNTTKTVTFAVTGITTSRIANGTSNVDIATANGNVTTAVAGNTILTVASTGANVAGLVTATGNITGGNIATSGIGVFVGNVVFGAEANTRNSGFLGYGTDSFGFTSEFNNAVFLRNEQTTTEQTLYLGDTGTSSTSTLFGIGSGTGNGTPVLTLSGIGNLTVANVTPTGMVSAAGNVIGSNLVTAGLVSATGNITGGNLNTGAQVVATGNITGGNITTAGSVTATGNVQTAANVVYANAAGSPRAYQFYNSAADSIDTVFI